jgi:hypothetical protein
VVAVSKSSNADPKVFASPLNTPNDVVTLDEPTDILCSYHYFSDVDMAQVHGWGTRIIGDSGAFSAETSGKPIDREKFHEWAAKWGDSLWWVASLDVIGNAPATRRNWEAAQADGLNLVPSIHYGATVSDLDWYVEQGVDFLGLGGMVAYSSEKARLMRWLIPLFRHVRDHAPHVRFHGWGISHPELLDKLPFYSTDSSGFSSAFRFATLRLWDVDKARFYTVDLDGKEPAKYARLLREHYGIHWKKIAVSTPEVRRDLGRVAVKAVQHYGRWLRSRQQVTAPRSLVASPATARPWQVSAMGRGGANSQAVNPENHSGLPASGPWQVGVVGRPGDSTGAVHPEAKTSAPRASRKEGPHAVTAFGVGRDSEILHPTRQRWPNIVGPVSAIADTTHEFVNPGEMK